MAVIIRKNYERSTDFYLRKMLIESLFGRLEAASTAPDEDVALFCQCC
jgi:hypothetical protein